MQIRARQDGFRPGLPPAAARQCLVWLEGIADYFFVPFKAPSGDNTIEVEMIHFLMECFDRKRKVKVEYYPIGASNFISAVWAND
jgi:hypothetical protein